MYEFVGAYGPYLWIALTLLTLGLAVWLLVLTRRMEAALSAYRGLVQGVQPAGLDSLLAQHLARVEDATGKVAVLEGEYARLASDVQRSIQHVGVVRFNPFPDVGGDQSVTIALLDARGDGLVITSLYGRTERRFYAKPVTGRQSSYQLSDEELKAIQRANGDVQGA
jgi:hypothetical protein